jgi:hypothetical protein
MNDTKYNIYDALLSDDEKGVNAISLVENPAIDEFFLKLANEEGLEEPNDNTNEVKVQFLNEEEQLLVGVILRPNRNIFRRAVKGFNNNKPFYIRFKPAIVKQIAWDYLNKCNVNNATIDHTETIPNTTLVETWINNDNNNDGITNGYTINSKPGDWVGIMKINDSKLWQRIKDEGLNGFSIEGLFGALPIQEMSKQLEINVNKLKINMISAIIKNELNN